MANGFRESRDFGTVLLIFFWTLTAFALQPAREQQKCTMPLMTSCIYCCTVYANIYGICTNLMYTQ